MYLKYRLLFILFLFVLNASLCQISSLPNEITLDAPDNGDKVYKAGKEINFLPGYNFDAKDGSLHAFIKKATQYGDLYSATDFANHELDDKLEIGTIPASHQVTETGGFSYNVPIELPNGINGMTPQLSISYNSQSGNGVLGMGWNLLGLSMISRTNKSIYHDDEVLHVKYNNDDAFSLDGSRLIKLDESNYIYGTESENFTRIKLNQANSSSQQWFEVETKEGVVIEYGKTENAKLRKDNHVLLWMISRVIDTKGNFYEYEYENVEGEYRIKEIKYTGNIRNGTSPIFKVQFNYTLREDAFTLYMSGKELVNKSLLENIKIYKNQTLLKSYEFDYGYKFYSYLSKVEHKNGDNKVTVNPTIFNYELSETDEISIAENQVGNLRSNKSTFYVPSDFLGDGKSDLLEVTIDTDELDDDEIEELIENFGRTTLSKKMNFRILSNQGEDDYDFHTVGNQTINSSSILAFGYGGYSHTNIAGQGFRTFDFDGDGKSDLFFYELNYNSGPDLFTISDIRFYKSVVTNGTVAFDRGDVNVNFGSQNYIRNIDQFSFIGDYNGDGIQDVLYVTQNLNGTNFFAGISKGGTNWMDLSSFGLTTQRVHSESEFDEFLATADRVEIIDFNGDGKSDVFIQKGNQIKVYTFEKGEIHGSNGAITENYARLLYESTLNLTNVPEYQFGDFNGDGLTDLVSFAVNKIKIHYSTGENFDIKEYDFQDFEIQEDKSLIRIIDINSDGKSDIVNFNNNYIDDGIYSGEEYKYVEVKVYEFNCDNFIKTSFIYSETPVMTASSYDRVENLIFGDFFGNGLTSTIVPVSNYRFSIYDDDINYNEMIRSWLNINRYYSFEINPDQRHLSKIKNGLNNDLKINYTNLDYLSMFGFEGATSNPSISPNYPIRDFVAPIKLVNDVSFKDNKGEDITTSYKYLGGKVHLLGKGFLGFTQTEQQESLNNTKSIQEYELNASILSFLPKKVRNINYLTNELLGESNHLHTLQLLPNNRFRITKTETESIDYITQSIMESIVEYDEFSNVKKETSKTYENNDKILTQVNEYKYNQFGSSLNFDNHVTSQKSTVIREGEDPFTSESTFDYYPVTGLLKEKNTHVNTPYEITEEYEYDVFGNGVKTTTKAIGEQDRVSETVYDTRGRLPIKTINELGQEATFEYHPIFDKPTKIIDADGLVSTSSYDEFGRLVETKDKSGIVSAVIKEWVNTNPAYTTGNPTDADDIMYKVTETRQGEPDKITYYNRLGQVRMKEIEGFNNAAIFSITTYNNKGQVVASTEPFFQGSSSISLSETTYDDYNRIASVTSNGETVTYTYEVENGLQKTTTTNPDGTTHIAYEDAAGNLIKSQDNGGLIEYSYFSHGGVNEIKLNSKVVATSEYDAIGRQTKLIDINAGTSTYTYTPFGEMKTSTNANGANRTKEYDEFGRLMQENVDGYIINYEYVAEGNGLNQLKKISTADGMEEIYDYDELGRVHTLTENIQGELFMFTYTYNELNQPESITYPSGLVVYNVYDDKGTLIKVTNAQGEIYWEGLEQDAFGRFTSFMKGDGVTTTYEFDAFQQLEEIKAGNIQHHTYQWDNQTGNLSERKDLIYGLQETFTYDNLNRLETGVASSITGGFVLNSISTEYEGNGNIAYKNDAGTYAYHEEKINAVITATNDIGQISGLTQDISYTSRQKAEFISEGDHTLNFVYGHDNHRRKTIYSNENGIQLEKYFIGLYEKEIEDNTIRHINYIMAGDGMTAIVVQEEERFVTQGGENDENEPITYYTYKDHLGSIVALTDESGDVVLEQSFDAWGRYRNPQDWTYNDVEEMPTWLRGYTGHEHLPHFDLINMNGRIYDPILGRMLSPDIYVQDPLFSQSYNRYSYCWNNPLRYTDPSGDFVWFVVGGAVLGSYIGGSVQQGTGAFWKWDKDFYKQGDFWKSATIGGMIGAGAGATLAAGVGATGTGLGAGFSANGGVASLGWNITSEALIAANINMASTALQGGDMNKVFTNGLIGLGAGAIGGAAGHYLNSGGFSGSKHTGQWTSQAIRAQNVTTSALSGFGTRLASSYEQGQTGWDPWINGVKGAAEGFYLGRISSNIRISGIGRFSKAGRYLSSFLSLGGTSVPGLGFTMAYYHAHIVSYQYFNSMPNPKNFKALALGSYAFGQFFNFVGTIAGYDNFQFHKKYNKYIIGDYYTFIKPFFF